MEWLKNKILESVSKTTDEAALAQYLLRAGGEIIKRNTPGSILNAQECASLALEQGSTSFAIKTRFDVLKWFYLSDGLHVIAAPSGHGKTMWAMQWAQEAAKQGMFTAFVSLEMTHKDIGARLLSEHSTLPLQQIARGDLSDVQRILLQEIAAANEQWKLIQVDKFDSLDWIKIEPRLFEHILKIRPRLVIVDFVQMIYDSSADEGRTSQQLANIARRLKNFADQNNCAVLLLSQMNREAIKEINRGRWTDLVPLSSSSVKESGGIVEAADSVQLVCIPERFEGCPDALRGKFQVLVDKNRKFGELGVSFIPFDISCGRFLA